MIEKISPDWAERLEHFRHVARHKVRPTQTIKNYDKTQLRMSFWQLVGRPYAALARMHAALARVESRALMALKRRQQPQP